MNFRSPPCSISLVRARNNLKKDVRMDRIRQPVAIPMKWILKYIYLAKRWIELTWHRSTGAARRGAFALFLFWMKPHCLCARMWICAAKGENMKLEKNMRGPRTTYSTVSVRIPNKILSELSDSTPPKILIQESRLSAIFPCWFWEFFSPHDWRLLLGNILCGAVQDVWRNTSAKRQTIHALQRQVKSTLFALSLGIDYPIAFWGYSSTQSDRFSDVCLRFEMISGWLHPRIPHGFRYWRGKNKYLRKIFAFMKTWKS